MRRVGESTDGPVGGTRLLTWGRWRGEGDEQVLLGAELRTVFQIVGGQVQRPWRHQWGAYPRNGWGGEEDEVGEGDRDLPGETLSPGVWVSF